MNPEKNAGPQAVPPIIERNGITRLSWGVSLAILALAVGLLLPPVRMTWQARGGRWAYILAVSGLISFGLTPFVIRLARFFQIFDLPASRKVHATPTPLLGGLAIYAAFTISILANSILDEQVVTILLGGTLLVIAGIVDDFRGAPAGIKLVIQLLACTVVIQSGVVLTLFPRTLLGSGANAALTAFWLLGITNAMNFFDGMDGLATGLSIITAGFLGFFAAMTFQPFLGWLAAAIVGACLGFLPFNFRLRWPAAIFLGDAGSTFLGFVLAALAVKGEWAENNFIDVGAPVLIFWVFIFDMVHISVTRIATGKVRTFREWIAYVGRDHLHHRFEALLHSKRKSVLLIFLLSICMGLGAIALVNAHTREAVVLILQAIVIVSVVTVLERGGNHADRRQ
ncbi:undecaprenyl/decaprenyl-phosphate alpha-N-acetylglucosaminyl 1-phosphate transferase [Patescibacteria group bacterium]|nr:MAG: undecaprenyl/decaprenyl-phosphate alpha-N-acetylglucosaminyl 1-phosphate transferase [Patescibacteria group bacterium]